MKRFHFMFGRSQALYLSLLSLSPCDHTQTHGQTHPTDRKKVEKSNRFLFLNSIFIAILSGWNLRSLCILFCDTFIPIFFILFLFSFVLLFRSVVICVARTRFSRLLSLWIETCFNSGLNWFTQTIIEHVINPFTWTAYWKCLTEIHSRSDFEAGKFRCSQFHEWQSR